MGRFGPWEIGLIILALLVLFGANKIPKFAKALGDSVRELRKAAETTDTKQESESPSTQTTADGSGSGAGAGERD